MFSIICSIFVALIISTNAGGPSVEQCIAEQPILNLMRNQINAAELNARKEIDEYVASNLSQSIDEFINDIQIIVSREYNNIKIEIAYYIETLAKEPQGTYDFSCIYNIQSDLESFFNSLKAYGDEIISKNIPI